MEGCISILVLSLALAVAAAVAAADDGSVGAKQETTLNFKVKSLASCLVNRDGQNALDRWSACLESMKHNEQLEESHTSDGNEPDVYVNRQDDIRGKIAGAFAQAQQVIANDVGGAFVRGFSYAKSLIGTRDPISNISSSAEDKNAPAEVADYTVQESNEINSLESAAQEPEADIPPEAQQPNGNSIEDGVLDHQLDLQNFETDKLDEEDVILVPQSRFTSNTEAPIQDESAGDESRKTLLLPFVVSAFIGVITALLRKYSKRDKIARVSKGEHSALCVPLGFALATTFAEVLRVDSCGPQVISKDELVELLEITMKNALVPVLDIQCGPFIDNLMRSFTMSYNTITSAQCLREKRIRGSGARVKDCNNSQDDEDVSKLVRNKHLENELPSRVDKVVEVKTEDSSLLSPEQLHKLDQVHDTLTTLTGSVEDEDASQELVQKFQHLSIGDAATINQQPRMGDIMLSSALSSASRTSHHSTSGAIHLFERYVVAQERRNCIKYMGLIEKERRTSMKEEQLQLTSEANTLMKENVEVSRSKFAFRRLEAHNQSLAAACSDLSSRCGDDFVAGLLIMGFSMIYCARKHCPVWLSELWTICQPDYKAKPTYSWQYMSWLYNVLEVFNRASLCVLKGTLGIVIGVVSFVTLAFLLFKMSTPSQSMPATIVVVIGGGLVGFAGKTTVELLGGNGLHWLIVWELLCCVHAFSNYFTASLVYLLHGTPDKSGRRRYYAVRRFAFHAALGYILPALAGLIAFPKVLENSGLLQLPTGILS